MDSVNLFWASQQTTAYFIICIQVVMRTMDFQQ